MHGLVVQRGQQADIVLVVQRGQQADIVFVYKIMLVILLWLLFPACLSHCGYCVSLVP